MKADILELQRELVKAIRRIWRSILHKQKGTGTNVYTIMIGI